MRPLPTPPSPPSPPMRAPPAPPSPLTPLTPGTEPNLSPVSTLTAHSTHHIPRRPVGTDANNGIANIPVPSVNKKATIQQSFSPIPQPIPHPLDSRLLYWETETATKGTPTTYIEPATSAPNITGNRPDQEAIPHPSEGNIKKPSALVPVPRREVGSQPALIARRSVTAPSIASPPAIAVEPAPVWKRISTAPIATEMDNVAANSSASPQMVMPRADQIARLNSRRGRPAGATDPRRSSRSFSQPLGRPNVNERSWNPSQNGTTAPATLEQTSHSHRAGTHGPSLIRPNTTYHLSGSQHPLNATPPSKHLSLINPNFHHAPSSDTNLRPAMPRLETIHSVNSAGEQTPGLPKPMAVGVARQPSRAERSAAKNIKDAKKRGWRAAMRKNDNWKGKEKNKRSDAASSAGWTDVLSESGTTNWGDERQRKNGSKCMVM